jgi:hypothetical protein
MENLDLTYHYEKEDFLAMLLEREAVTRCWAKRFDGILLRAGERHLTAKFFWRERGNGGGCNVEKLKAFVSRFA